MWQGGPAEHPDEGTIHAWLDEALDATSAGRVATHVSSCAECAARVAEARGLIAGASRIVAALDDSPSVERPPWAQPASTTEAGGASRRATAGVGAAANARGGSLWRWLRVTPGRAAIAATILVAIGVTLTHERVAEETAARDARSVAAVHNETELRRGASQSATGGSPAAAATAPAAAPAAAPGTRPPPVARDEAANSTAAKNFARARSVPTIERASGAASPPEPAAEAAAPALATAPEARGRAAEKETVAADAASRAAAAPAPAPARAAAKAAPREQQPPEVSAGMATSQRRLDVAKECYRVQGSQPGERWGGLLLPVLVALEAGPSTAPRAATVRATTAAGPTRRATWIRTSSDSVRLTLDDTTAPPILLGAESAGRAGTIGSRGEVVVGRVDCESGAPVR